MKSFATNKKTYFQKGLYPCKTKQNYPKNREGAPQFLSANTLAISEKSVSP